MAQAAKAVTPSGEWRHAVGADRHQAERPERETRRDHRGVYTKDATAPLGRGKADNPGFAEHEERADGEADEEAKREPGNDVLGQPDQQEGKRCTSRAGHGERARAEPARQRRDEGRAGDQPERRHCCGEADRRRGMALPLQDEGEQRVAEPLRDREDRYRRDDAGERRPRRRDPRFPLQSGDSWSDPVPRASLATETRRTPPERPPPSLGGKRVDLAPPVP